MSTEYCGCGHSWAMHNEYGCYKRDGGIAGHDTYCMCSSKPPQMLADEAERNRMRQLLYPCPAHRRYQIKRRPRTACEKCWRMWIEVNP